ncbi:23S rRNA (adenine(2503)-C(2))-methyltransferase RlmN, partial [bacterium]|nr:23S rRNA (adenine(2503)-C(2))-methyltransferase RlmN [bacterium]
KSFDECINVKKDTIEKLKQDFSFTSLTLLEKKTDIDVSKYLFELEDHNKIEAVLMNHDYGKSLCVSTEVGCNMGCKFCESGRLKKVRNLETNEMVEQILKIEELEQIRISHVVLMGIGEPFDNYDNVIDFIDIINEGKGIDIGARHITISTCGIVPKIEKFMEHGKQVNLAISLHAPNDDLRSKLMPINKAYPLKELIQVLKKYVEITNRRVTFEYILLKGINDTPENALELSNLVKNLNCYINLIPYNETSHIEFKRAEKEAILKFYDILKQNHVNVTIRREFGTKVMAACGQLRSNYEEGK